MRSLKIIVTIAIFALLCMATAEAQETPASSPPAGNANTTTTQPPRPTMGWKAWVCTAACIFLLLVLYFNLASCAAAMFGISLFLLLCGIISVKEFLSGLSNPGVITIALLFIIIAPVSDLPVMRRLVKYGIAQCSCYPGLWFLRLKICALCMAGSWFVNNTPLVAMLTPLLKQACREINESPAQILMSMNIATLIGGTFAVIGTSTNLIYDGLMRNTPMGPMPFFEMIKVSGVPGVLALIYLVVMPPFLLPKHTTGLLRMIKKENKNFLAHMLVSATSRLVGQRIDQLPNLIPNVVQEDTQLIEIVQKDDGEVIAPPKAWYVVRAGDVLVFTGHIKTLKRYAQLLHLKWVPQNVVADHVSRTASRLLSNHSQNKESIKNDSSHNLINDSIVVGRNNNDDEEKNDRGDDGVNAAAIVIPPQDEYATGMGDTHLATTQVTSMDTANTNSVYEAHHSSHHEPVHDSSVPVVPSITQLRTVSVKRVNTAIVPSTVGHFGHMPSSQRNYGSSEDVTGSAAFHRVEVVSSLTDINFKAPPATAAPVIAEEPLFVECVVGNRCPAIGSTISSGVFQRRYGVSILAYRGVGTLAQETRHLELGNCVIHAADTLLVLGPVSFTQKFEHEFYVCTVDDEDEFGADLADHYIRVPHWFCIGHELENPQSVHIKENVEMTELSPGASPAQSPTSVNKEEGERRVSVTNASITKSTKTPQKPTKVVRIPHAYRYLAVVVFVTMMSCAIAGFDILICASCACFAMVILRLISLQRAYEEIELEVMIMVAFSFGLGYSMDNSGLAAVIGDLIDRANITGFPLLLLIAVVATIITNVITNKACAQVLFPVVYKIYVTQGKNPLPGIMVLACTTSCALSTPYGFATNLIIFGPGGYTARDFVKFGVPLNILLALSMATMGSLVYNDW